MLLVLKGRLLRDTRSVIASCFLKLQQVVEICLLFYWWLSGIGLSKESVSVGLSLYLSRILFGITVILLASRRGQHTVWNVVLELSFRTGIFCAIRSPDKFNLL